MTAQAQRTAVTAGIILLVIVVIGYGLYLVGSPGEARLRRLDERRVEDLQSLRSHIDAHWARERRVPAALADLKTAPSDTSQLRDPITHEPYGYRATSDSTFELCAKFDRPSEEERRGPRDSWWGHGQGEHCYPLTAMKAPASPY